MLPAGGKDLWSYYRCLHPQIQFASSHVWEQSDTVFSDLLSWSRETVLPLCNAVNEIEVSLRERICLASNCVCVTSKLLSTPMKPGKEVTQYTHIYTMVVICVFCHREMWFCGRNAGIIFQINIIVFAFWCPFICTCLVLEHAVPQLHLMRRQIRLLNWLIIRFIAIFYVRSNQVTLMQIIIEPIILYV
jgi:hypothetical protein